MEAVRRGLGEEAFADTWDGTFEDAYPPASLMLWHSAGRRPSSPPAPMFPGRGGHNGAAKGQSRAAGRPAAGPPVRFAVAVVRDGDCSCRPAVRPGRLLLPVTLRPPGSAARPASGVAVVLDQSQAFRARSLEVGIPMFRRSDSSAALASASARDRAVVSWRRPSSTHRSRQ